MLLRYILLLWRRRAFAFMEKARKRGDGKAGRRRGRLEKEREVGVGHQPSHSLDKNKII